VNTPPRYAKSLDIREIISDLNNQQQIFKSGCRPFADGECDFRKEFSFFSCERVTQCKADIPLKNLDMILVKPSQVLFEFLAQIRS
jgi:hypothetical protein